MAKWHGTEAAHLAGITPVALRARHLISLVCLRGGGTPPDVSDDLAAIAAWVENEPDVLVTLTSAFDCRGGPYQFPREDTPQDRRMDLHVLQRLGLTPGDTRAARDLFRRLPQAIPSLDGICVFESPTDNWPSWPAEAVAAYGRGLAAPLPGVQTEQQMAEAKSASVAEIESADQICLRPHHLLCILCYYGGGSDEPLQADNLWEPLMRMLREPDLPVTLVEGDCMVCPPCAGFDPDSGICVAGCGLKDRRKDLDTLQLLDLLPGDSLPARELLRRYRDRVATTGLVCDFGTGQIPDWASCGSSDGVSYQRALDRLAAWLDE